MLLVQIKKDMIQATKSKDTTRKNILKMVISESDRLLNTTNQNGKPISDDQVYKIMQELMKNNTKLLDHRDDLNLKAENDILKEYLSTILTIEQIKDILQPIISEIKACKAGGQANGIAIQFIKNQKLSANNTDVCSVVSSLRS